MQTELTRSAVRYATVLKFQESNEWSCQRIIRYWVIYHLFDNYHVVGLQAQWNLKFISGNICFLSRSERNLFGRQVLRTLTVYSLVRSIFYGFIFVNYKKWPIWCQGKGEMYFSVPQTCKEMFTRQICLLFNKFSFGVWNNCKDVGVYCCYWSCMVKGEIHLKIITLLK